LDDIELYCEIKEGLGLQNEPQNAQGAVCIQSLIIKALLGLISSSDDPQKIENLQMAKLQLRTCVWVLSQEPQPNTKCK
jgi:hypothetical protein